MKVFPCIRFTRVARKQQFNIRCEKVQAALLLEILVYTTYQEGPY